jgi:hypothetical protein
VVSCFGGEEPSRRIVAKAVSGGVVAELCWRSSSAGWSCCCALVGGPSVVILEASVVVVW